MFAPCWVDRGDLLLAHAFFHLQSESQISLVHPVRLVVAVLVFRLGSLRMNSTVVALLGAFSKHATISARWVIQ